MVGISAKQILKSLKCNYNIRSFTVPTFMCILVAFKILSFLCNKLTLVTFISAAKYDIYQQLLHALSHLPECEFLCRSKFWGFFAIKSHLSQGYLQRNMSIVDRKGPYRIQSAKGLLRLNTVDQVFFMAIKYHIVETADSKILWRQFHGDRFLSSIYCASCLYRPPMGEWITGVFSQVVFN